MISLSMISLSISIIRPTEALLNLGPVYFYIGGREVCLVGRIMLRYRFYVFIIRRCVYVYMRVATVMWVYAN